eukprot:TRINITY_DN4865_c0_g1_i2.p1 TRINITY_DN4865_c0_g1~~TRINITY_DN4865_c0_g1_i2.p1  ORF type:complete len:288 (-),score=33.53 TRINITY_DN4865_c0_g1_i2:247-1110(-)
MELRIEYECGAYRVMEKVLAKGAYSVVKLAANHQKDKILAVKVIDLFRYREYYEKEVNVLSRFQHPNVVHFVFAHFDDRKGYIFMEKLPRETLEDVLVAPEIQFPMDFESLFVFTSQMTSALEHIHSKGISHRDIKPSNIIIEKTTNQAYLLDFGLCYISPDHPVWRHCSSEKVGSPLYISPEVLLKNSYDPFKVDFWGLGIVLFCMLTGGPRFVNVTKLSELVECVSGTDRVDLPEDLDKDLQTLVRGLLDYDPDKRWSLKELNNWIQITQTGRNIDVSTLTTKFN